MVAQRREYCSSSGKKKNPLSKKGLKKKKRKNSGSAANGQIHVFKAIRKNEARMDDKSLSLMQLCKRKKGVLFGHLKRRRYGYASCSTHLCLQAYTHTTNKQTHKRLREREIARELSSRQTTSNCPFFSFWVQNAIKEVHVCCSQPLILFKEKKKRIDKQIKKKTKTEAKRKKKRRGSVLVKKKGRAGIERSGLCDSSVAIAHPRFAFFFTGACVRERETPYHKKRKESERTGERQRIKKEVEEV